MNAINWNSLFAVFLLALQGNSFGQGFNQKILRNGDLIFQTSMSGQSQAIQAATHSPYSHCGIIFIKNGNAFVFEASATVRQSPFERFIGKGKGKAFVVKRLKNADSVLTTENLKRMETIGKSFEGLPYDPFFSWDDERIYCSELVYKIYMKATGIEIGELSKLKDFDLSNPKVIEKMKQRYGEKIPMEERVISPASQFADPKLMEVFNNYQGRR